jgi:hypothetical protein
MTIRKMIVWASGLIEFIGNVPEPDGSILVCTANHPHDIEELLAVVQEQAILDDFGDVVGLRVPGIDPRRPVIESGVDFTVDILMRWEDDIRRILGEVRQIEWTRS